MFKFDGGSRVLSLVPGDCEGLSRVEGASQGNSG